MRDGIIQRGRTWSYVVRERDPQTGKTKPRWVGGFATRKAAKDARDSARHAVNRGTYVAPQNLTVGEYLDRWIAAHSVELKPSTAKSYRDNIARYLKPTIGHERVQALSPSRLSVLFADLYGKGGKDGKALSPRTVEFARAVLRRAMQDAVLDRIIEVNPVVGTKRPTVVKPKHTTWTGAQLQAFLGGLIETDRWASLWTLAAATGMRRGELMALKWARVDLEAGVVHVEQSVTQIGQERHYVTPKNHERRSVTIDPRTVATLKAWRKAQLAERLAWGAAYRGDEGLVFTWEDGRPVLPDFVTKAFGSLTAGVDGVPRIKLHELRHTHATILLRDGVPVHVVAKRLGHKDPSVTLNVYADAIPDDDGRAVDTFTKAVWGA
ncbi:integrase [Intrasporangium chromatireducens Q5-1]|uniref:Integrase n=2 Tax=Intrasporangium TaxID=53357 RepID=W9GIT9_9MICO|nr:integrase [Intrasporangium chromatireducens Q5-1]